MRRLLLVLGGLIALPALAHAQSIHGVVLEDGSRTPIAGVVVTIEGQSVTAQTGADGRFILLPRRPGPLRLQLRHISYAPVDSDTLGVRVAESVELELRMARTAIPLEPLVVTARSRTNLDGFHERRQRAGSGRFVTRDEIRVHRGNHATDVLREVPGVEISSSFICRGMCEPTRSQTLGLVSSRYLVMRRVAGYCAPVIYVDGMKMTQHAEAGIDDFLKPDMLEGVEVYPRSTGAPAEWVDPEGCGVVAFWTRRDTGGGSWSWKKLAAGAGFFAGMVLLTR